jgi:hypothetical protein
MGIIKTARHFPSSWKSQDCFFRSPRMNTDSGKQGALPQNERTEK